MGAPVLAGADDRRRTLPLGPDADRAIHELQAEPELARRRARVQLRDPQARIIAGGCRRAAPVWRHRPRRGDPQRHRRAHLGRLPDWNGAGAVPDRDRLQRFRCIALHRPEGPPGVHVRLRPAGLCQQLPPGPGARVLLLPGLGRQVEHQPVRLRPDQGQVAARRGQVRLQQAGGLDVLERGRQRPPGVPAGLPEQDEVNRRQDPDRQRPGRHEQARPGRTVGPADVRGLPHQRPGSGFPVHHVQLVR